MDPNSQSAGNQELPVATPVAHEPFPMPPRSRSRFLGRLLLVFLVLGLFGSLLLNVMLFAAANLGGFASLEMDRKVQEKHFSHRRSAENKVAIISVEGTILTGEGFVKRQIDRAMKDPDVKAVVLRVNSPGGTVSGSDYMYHHLCELAKKKKMVVSMGGLAASGGYYVSMAVGDTPDTIFAEPTTWTGSIGVIIPHYDLSKMLTKWGVEEDSIASDRFKGMGSFAKPMTPEEREIFKELVAESFTQFKQIIRSGRPKFDKDPDALNKLATGQIYTAQQAKENGLVDEIGFIETAIDRAIELANLDEDDVNVVEYNREPSLAALLLGSKARNQPFDLAAMLELTAPRAYYLCTWLPPLASSDKP